MGDGREGDWECGGCRNRNYAFRSFCNRCKQPRLLMDTNMPPDSKWLPRIGDWICTGCTNNNYASREKCKKCGQPREVAAMPALAMPGPSLPTHLQYFAGAMSQSSALLAYSNTASQALVPKGWRNGDWFCRCGFHNYSSRLQCKNCNEAAPPALGTKRLASEALAPEWDSKRLNQGYASMQLQPAVSASYPGISSGSAPNWQAPLPFLQQTLTAALLGKGAKQWRNGDWMCANCNNHNYASRPECNRCKTKRDTVPEANTLVLS
ncbi:PREDICTED: calpain-15 [Tarenaya hassleriana]|uniref:calpain-15 n=1 Tax=Tarenaya hassleriana TaxID=28532 RepID=UPI00053C3540|nr:PREDICTED: calpain-15 [Tarenaya hassleriana]